MDDGTLYKVILVIAGGFLFNPITVDVVNVRVVLICNVFVIDSNFAAQG